MKTSEGDVIRTLRANRVIVHATLHVRRLHPRKTSNVLITGQVRPSMCSEGLA
jgi:hypothetical protein